jgi:hypothetical protein
VIIWPHKLFVRQTISEDCANWTNHRILLNPTVSPSSWRPGKQSNFARLLNRFAPRAQIARKNSIKTGIYRQNRHLARLDNWHTICMFEEYGLVVIVAVFFQLS